MESSGIEHMEVDEESSLLFSEGEESFRSVFEDDFQQNLAMLDFVDVEEVMIAVQNSHEEEVSLSLQEHGPLTYFTGYACTKKVIVPGGSSRETRRFRL